MSAVAKDRHPSLAGEAFLREWFTDYVGSPESMRALADGTLALPPGTPDDYVVENLDEIPGRFEGHDRAPQAADFAFIERVKAARQASGDGGEAGSKFDSGR